MLFMFSQVLLNSNTFYKSLKMRVLHTKMISYRRRTYEAEVDEKGAFSAFSSSSFNVTLLLCVHRGVEFRHSDARLSVCGKSMTILLFPSSQWH